jgi:hypothetical protein
MLDAAGGGALAGYAWSPNIGWISLDTADLGGCPSGACSATADWAHPNADTSINIKGWARACSVFASGCNGALADNALRGNWDGWIALSNPSGSNWTGTNSVRFNAGTGDFSGFAWGDQVVGWLDFTGVKSDLTPPTSGIRLVPTTYPIPTNNGNTIAGYSWGISVPNTQTSVILSWYKVEPSTVYTSCTQTSSGSAPSWTASGAVDAGTIPFGTANWTSLPGVRYGAPADQSYTLTCTKAEGGTDSWTATVQTNSCPTGTTGTPPNCVNDPGNTKYCPDGAPAPSNDLTKCPATTHKCADGSNAPNNDPAQCPTTSVGTPYCTNLPRYTQTTPPKDVIVKDGKCSCPVGKIMKLVNGTYNCAASHYEEH